MRPYPVVDDEPNEESHARVIPIRSAPRGRAQPIPGRTFRREPWMPTDQEARPIVGRPEPAMTPPAPAPQQTLSVMHRWMLAVFFTICALMIVTMFAWRLLSEAVRPPTSSTAEPSTVAQPVAPPPQQSVVVAPTVPPVPTVPPGTGPIVTDIRVLQPNYTVAPGDTLASIARRHGTTIEALASINNLENRNSLSVGQKLIIP